MSVFFLNTCKFDKCGLKFSTLQELIYHIEDTHLDFESKNGDEFKQASCMPVSYIFRLSSKDYTNQSSIKPKSLNSNFNVTLNNSRRKDSGSELDEENYESESEKSSIDSWSNNSIESDTNTILKIINTPKSVQNNKSSDDSEKPYICQVTNCKKRYRNSNGLKYHTKSVHTENGIKKEPAAPRMYRCACNKNYKTIYGLKNHAKQCATALQTVVTSPTTNGQSTTFDNSSTYATATTPLSNSTTKPIISMTVLPSSPDEIEQESSSNNQMEEDDRSDHDIKPSSINLLSSIETKPQFTSQA